MRPVSDLKNEGLLAKCALLELSFQCLMGNSIYIIQFTLKDRPYTDPGLQGGE